MKTIPLHGKYGKGKYALVDDDKFDLLNQFRWVLAHNGYVQSYPSRKQSKFPSFILMHRIVLGLTNRLDYADHINQDKLDNQAANLRLATPFQSNGNVLKRNLQKATSKYKGVSWSRLNNNWRVRITKDRNEMWIGAFPTEKAAAQIYNMHARALFGDFAHLNVLQ